MPVNTDEPKTKFDFYDDQNHDYEDFWKGREYEQESENVALKKLLQGKHFKKAVDLGGGYGRLSLFLEDYADEIILVEPSSKQLSKAKNYLKDYSNVSFYQLDDQNHMPIEDNSIDLLLMVRVTHHLIDPTDTFNDIARVLKPRGHAIIEVANYSHFLHRMKAMSHFQKLPSEPVRVGEVANGKKDITPFVNHNPETIIQQLRNAGLVTQDVLSVSNFRQATLKSIFSPQQLVKIETLLQRPLAKIYFGPSIFLWIEKP